MVIEMRRVLFAVLGASAIDAWAAVHACIGKDGVERRQDHYIAECADQEQRILNADGSTKAVIPPTLTPEQHAEREAQKRSKEEERKRREEAARSDRDLLKRYPNEQAHKAKRKSDLKDVERAMNDSRARLEQLDSERKLLLQEAEFYRGRTVPAKLKDRMADNDASMAAQREVIQAQQAEQTRINKIFDMELERLRKLWNGAPPGSLGPPLR